MAGIGFELRKLLRQDSYFALVRAYSYAGLISSGPWVLSIVGLVVIGILSNSIVAPSILVTQFQVSVTYLIAGSLILTGMVQLSFTRWVSDRLYEKKSDMIVPNFAGVLLVINLVGDQIRDLGEPHLIAEITRQILLEHAVDEDRVYVAGLSAGGAAAAIMGATYPDLYAAVGIHSGLACGAARDMHAAFSAMRQGAPAARLPVRIGPVVPTIVFHGDRDTTVNPVNGDQASEQASGGPGVRTRLSHGATATGIAFTRTIRFDAQERAIGEQWVLEGLGHAWSGGSALGTFTDPRGPDASREFVRFFFEHRLSSRNPELVSRGLPASAGK